jgi:LytS/YehU family sensor histidine kinase
LTVQRRKIQNRFQALLINWTVLTLALLIASFLISLGWLLKAVNLNFQSFIFFSLIGLFTAMMWGYFKQKLKEEPEQAKAYQSHLILKIAKQTLPYLRQGFNRESAQKVAEIINKESRAIAVAVTDTTSVLAFNGAGSAHHQPGMPILTKATKEALDAGEVRTLFSSEEIGCPKEDCPLRAAIIVPLKKKSKVLGSLKFYFSSPEEVTEAEVAVAEGLAHLLETQVELSELARLETLACEAELKTLQAQINPHFFFNILNTAVSYCRSNPAEARRLLVIFADFFRKTLEQEEEGLISMKEELEYLNTYLELEKARFGGRLEVELAFLAEDINNWKVPSFTLQPIVENAINYAFKEVEPLRIKIKLEKRNGVGRIVIEDNGVGIASHELPHILKRGFGKGLGLGLNLIHERLRLLFGEEYGLSVESERGKGTRVTVSIPLSNSS